MIPMDEDEPSGLDLVALIKSQCVDMTDVVFRASQHFELIEWLKENAGERLEEIPFADAEIGFLPNIQDKWATFFSSIKVIYWIQNKRVRVEFIMRWL
jgi:hypothetical protein